MQVELHKNERNEIVTLFLKEVEHSNTPKIWTYLGDFGGAQTSYKSTNKTITMDVLTVRVSSLSVIVY